MKMVASVFILLFLLVLSNCSDGGLVKVPLTKKSSNNLRSPLDKHADKNREQIAYLAERAKSLGDSARQLFEIAQEQVVKADILSRRTSQFIQSKKSRMKKHRELCDGTCVPPCEEYCNYICGEGAIIVPRQCKIHNFCHRHCTMECKKNHCSYQFRLGSRRQGLSTGKNL